jgi:hypothetical protein
MPLNWPGAFTHGGNLPEEIQQQVRQMLDDFGAALVSQLAALGLPAHASPVYRPFSLAVVRDDVQVLVGFSPATGMAVINWIDQPDMRYQPAAMVDLLTNQLGREVAAVISLPRPDNPAREVLVYASAVAHAKEIEALQVLGRLGDISPVRHLEEYLRRFLGDHPDPDRNVFVMMRFNDTDQMKQVYETIKSGLASRGMHAVRADDRDFTGELWSNIKVYLTGCHYGIAVFEDIDQRDYNPNVSLELGYMMGRGKRTLLLKEKRLPRLPSDVVHRLYKEFDIFDIATSVEREVGRWIDVDLRLEF